MAKNILVSGWSWILYIRNPGGQCLTSHISSYIMHLLPWLHSKIATFHAVDSSSPKKNLESFCAQRLVATIYYSQHVYEKMKNWKTLRYSLVAHEQKWHFSEYYAISTHVSLAAINCIPKTWFWNIEYDTYSCYINDQMKGIGYIGEILCELKKEVWTWTWTSKLILKFQCSGFPWKPR